MLKIQQEASTDGTLVLSLEGDATIESVAQLKQVLLTALEERERVSIDCSATQNIDLYALQLLCSSHRSFMAKQKKLTFLGKVSKSVQQTIQATGLMREIGCTLCTEEDICMWSGHNSTSAA